MLGKACSAPGGTLATEVMPYDVDRLDQAGESSGRLNLPNLDSSSEYGLHLQMSTQPQDPHHDMTPISPKHS